MRYPNRPFRFGHSLLRGFGSKFQCTTLAVDDLRLIAPLAASCLPVQRELLRAPMTFGQDSFRGSSPGLQGLSAESCYRQPSLDPGNVAKIRQLFRNLATIQIGFSRESGTRLRARVKAGQGNGIRLPAMAAVSLTQAFLGFGRYHTAGNEGIASTGLLGRFLGI